VGEAEVERESRSTSADGHNSRQRSTQHRALATADQLRRLEPGTALLLYEHLQPTRLTLRSSTHDAALRKATCPARHSATPEPTAAAEGRRWS
jgi:type IV secretory pathway TraG/TraD family ATPase VirD4